MQSSAAGSGSADVRSGFAFDKESDLQFALGWPHIRIIDDAPMDDQAAVEAARRVLVPLDPSPRLHWNRRLATALVRALGLSAAFEIGPDEKSLRLPAEEALWNPSLLERHEVEEGLAVRLSNTLLGVSDRTIESWVLLAEALVGTLAVAESIVDILEQLPNSVLTTRWTLPPFVTYQLGYLFLRLPEATVESLQARLQALLLKAGGDPARGRMPWEDGYTHLRAIHLVLAGAEAAKRGSDRNLSWYTHARGDANFVRMRVAMDRLGYRPDARLVFLGGAEVLSSYARRWQKMDGEDQRWFFEQMAPIADERAATIFLEMSAASAIRPLATRWFMDHRDFVRPLLLRAAETDGTNANAARALLKQL